MGEEENPAFIFSSPILFFFIVYPMIWMFSKQPGAYPIKSQKVASL